MVLRNFHHISSVAYHLVISSDPYLSRIIVLCVRFDHLYTVFIALCSSSLILVPTSFEKHAI